MAPAMNPTGQGKWRSQWVAAATAKVVNATHPTAEERDGAEVIAELPPTHRDGGRVNDRWQDQEQDKILEPEAIVGRSGNSARTTPVRTNRIAEGSLSRAPEKKSTTAMTASKTTKSWSVATMNQNARQ